MISTIDKNKIKQIISQNNIVHVIGRYIKIEKHGSNYRACCPFHKEDHPSFYINEARQFFYCFGCSIGGDVIKFLQQYKKINFFEAVKVLSPNDNFNSNKKEIINSYQNKAKLYSILHRASYLYHKELYINNKKDLPIKYLKKRGISGITSKEFLIGFAENSWNKIFNIFGEGEGKNDLILQSGLCKVSKKGIFDVFRNRIIFPIKDKIGRIIGLGGRSIDENIKPKYINSADNEIFKKGKNLYGLYEAKTYIQNKDSVLVVEGYVDVITLSQSGIKNVVSILGSNITLEQIDLLLSFTKNIYFCFDGDYAGQKAAIRTMEIILPILKTGYSIKFIFLPFNIDPDGYLSKYGKSKFITLYKKAVSLTNFIIHMLIKNINLKNIEDKKRLVSRTFYMLKKIPNDHILKNLIKLDVSKLVGIDISIFSLKEKKQLKKKEEKIPLEICLKAAMILLENPIFINRMKKNIILSLNNKQTSEVFYSKKLIGYNLLKIIINNIYSKKINMNTIKMFLKKKKYYLFKDLHEIIDNSSKNTLYKDFTEIFKTIKNVKFFFNLYILLKKKK